MGGLGVGNHRHRGHRHMMTAPLASGYGTGPIAGKHRETDLEQANADAKRQAYGAAGPHR